MVDFNNLQLNHDNGILTITINRAEKLNALNLDTIDELREAFQEVYDNDQVKSVIITGQGEKAFVAGADISEIAELNEMNGRKFAESGQEVFSMIEKCHKPVIAAVNGFALGGGCELAMACHIRIATPNAKFGQPEVNLGIIPGYGGTQRLTQLIGKAKALELMMTADFISAEEAKSLGLVNHLADNHEELINKAKGILQKINSKAPLAIGMVIESVNAYYADGENGYQTEANSFASCCKSEDFKEGTKAFLEKRAAEFKGE
ncbi:enoyl-CoA hydratase/isomerase family protein [Marivirga sp. S37H4]|uniref:Enoyl-CoA hydratase/isomerase family protein n=1 Tax=Marivirga aurantiaca TaxID=2802615 RepID=A0A934WYK4_9BACT|nr:enoyl-CoA hydratase-related protein [Marivirga aurantiaca]MBK6265171.1 enoyl-CoA hydratase/isomerase family protein [Marivirga aurantiaca]